VIGALILGLVAGFIARAILPGRQSMNFLLTIVLGLAGAALGWLLFTKLIGIGDDDAFDLGGLPGAIVGAVILLWAYERFVASRGPTGTASAGPERSRAQREEGVAERRRRRGAGDRPGGRRGRAGDLGGEARRGGERPPEPPAS
jgi:uncharacterized membrane protein YeaQ/YmgE (transglycosylase-associated protein family)